MGITVVLPASLVRIKKDTPLNVSGHRQLSTCAINGKKLPSQENLELLGGVSNNSGFSSNLELQKCLPHAILNLYFVIARHLVCAFLLLFNICP